MTEPISIPELRRLQSLHGRTWHLNAEEFAALLDLAEAAHAYKQASTPFITGTVASSQLAAALARFTF